MNMKFSEIIGLQDYFHPVFNMENEEGSYWKKFIPNDRFDEVIDKTLLAVDSPDIRNKLSIWLVGRYGTGKSHVSSVIKHLLCDDLTNIKDYLNERIAKTNIREKIKAFRRTKKLFPVVLKGGGNVTDAQTLSLEIERAVKKSLKKNDIEIQTKSDFEKIIERVNDELINWDVIINNNPDLEMYVNNKEDIIKKLENEDIEFLKIIERILSEHKTHFSHEKISVWLQEVTKELTDKKLANGLIIFWDEFTTILERESISEIINEIQSIAELSQSNNVYLYLISHRDYNQFGTNVQEVLDKVKDRFHNIQYPMVSVTTYQILSAAIKKKNLEQWQSLKEATYSNSEINNLVEYITDISDGVGVKNSIKDLYPIHPYTVYLSTSLANNIGSTQRSIFKFIYDSTFGLIKFLDNEINEKKLLTANLLWDFYAEELDRDKDNRFMQVLEKFNAYKIQVEKENPDYLKVFKGILLLNALSRITESSNPDTDKVIPNEKNIKKFFIGTDINDNIDDALNYINEKAIIQKNPDDRFEISSTSLPINEINTEKEHLKNEYKDIIKIIEFHGKSKIERFFNDENGILRKIRVKFFSSDTSYTLLKNNLSIHFPPSYFLDFAVFVKLTNDENDKIQNLINQVKNEDEFKHITFINITEPFGEKGYNNFIERLARANVYRNHSYNDESTKEEEFAKQVINTWIGQINYLDIFTSFLGRKVVEDIKSIGVYINKIIAPTIFDKGIDTLPIKIATVWQFQSAKKAIEYILKSTNRTHLETEPTGQYRYIKNIFKDYNSEYIIDNTLKVKNTSINHSVVEVYTQVKNTIEKASHNPSFNLAKELKFLTKPPYGLYTNILNMAILGFAFRDFVDKLYAANSGILIDKMGMHDKVNEIFECWQKKKSCDKLNVRLGSEEERDLIAELANLFKIKNATGLQNVRWKIKEKINDISFPMWSLKFGDIQDEKRWPIIDKINKIVFELSDTEINISLVQDLLPELKNNHFDLQQIFDDYNFEKGFKNFILSHMKNKISNNEVDKVIEFIRREQPEELNWQERDVENSIFKYIFDKSNSLSTPHTTDDSTPQPPNNLTPQQAGREEPDPNIIKQVRNKINNCKSFDKFKEKILMLLKEQPDIANILNKLL